MTTANDLTVADGTHLSVDQQAGWQDIQTQHSTFISNTREFWHTYGLPTAKELGDKLNALKATYSDGKKGPGGTKSSFIEDAENFAGVKRTSVYNYLLISESWDLIQTRLNALPYDDCLSISGALRIISDAKQLTGDKTDLEDAADTIDDEDDDEQLATIDAEAEVVGEPEPEPKPRISDSVRQSALVQLQGLKAVKGLPPKLITRIDELVKSVELVLKMVDEATEAPKPEWSDDTKDQPAPAAEQPATPVESTDKTLSLPELYPKTAQGLALLEADKEAAGSDKALADQLSTTANNVRVHRKRIREALSKTAGETIAA